MICELCLEHPADEEISEKEGMLLCKECYEGRQSARRIATGGDFLDRDASALCTRCGVCCFMLSAVVTPDEIHKLCKWSGDLPTEITHIEEHGPNKGLLVFNRPCKYLLGKPLKYVRCRAYGTDRPAVCGSYLCKLAIQYKVGLCTRSEALFLLREAFLRGDPTIFNWSEDQDDPEQKLMMQSAANRARSALRDRGVEEPMIDVMITGALLPQYILPTRAHEIGLRAHLFMSDQDEVNIHLLYEPEELETMSPEELAIALETQRRYMRVIREMFEKV